MKLGIVKDKKYLNHHMGDFHVESPKRLESIYELFEGKTSFDYQDITPRLASEKEIQMIHSRDYFNLIKKTSEKPRVMLDPDTSTSSRSYETALLAAGGLLEGIDFIMEDKINNGFALIRPPGHHAEQSRAMGFCIFNNVAIAAEYLRNEYNVERILIVDWDLHHGNGTQNSFYKTDKILYFSTHQYPHYPGTGTAVEAGLSDGEGFTVNIPLLPGKTEEDYLYIYKNILNPIAADFKPEFVLVSAGFDIYKGDPLGGMNVTVEGFGALAHELLKLAQRYAESRILFILEGGYDLTGLKRGVESVLKQMSGIAEPPSIKPALSQSSENELEPVYSIQRKYWNL